MISFSSMQQLSFVTPLLVAKKTSFLKPTRRNPAETKSNVFKFQEYFGINHMLMCSTRTINCAPWNICIWCIAYEYMRHVFS